MDKLILRIFISLIIVTSLFYAQNKKTQESTGDTIKTSDKLIQTNTLLRDWRIFNYPFLNNSNLGYSRQSIYSSQFSTTNSSLNNFTASKEEMLFQFRSLQNWDTKKKYNAFAEYLRYAQFLGVAGLLGVHIYQWTKLKNTPSKKIQPKTYNRYDFK